MNGLPAASLAKLNCCSQGRNSLREQRLREGNDFDRQRKLAQHRDLLARVTDDDQLPGRRSDDLFPQQRAAAAFDEIQLRIEFVGAVDGDVDLLEFLERGQRNAQATARSLVCTEVGMPRIFSPARTRSPRKRTA